MKTRLLFLATMTLFFGTVFKTSGQILYAPNTTISYSPNGVYYNGGGSNVANTSFGSGALQANSAGWANTAIGFSAMLNNTLGQYNTAIGYQALSSNIGSAAGTTDSGYYNVALGVRSLTSNTYGSHNIGIGYDALRYSTTGLYNIGIGTSALGSGAYTGSGNVAVGFVNGVNLTTGSNNSLFGNCAGGVTALSSGSRNCFFGYSAGDKITTGNANVMIGASCGLGLTTGGWNTFLGSAITVPSIASTATSAGNDTYQTIILADGQGFQRLYIHNNGNTGIGLGNNAIPVNRLDVKGGVVIGRNYTPQLSPVIIGAVSPSDGLLVEGRVGIGNTSPNNKVEITEPPVDAYGRSGLRFTNLTNAKTASTNAGGKVLSVNSTGDVILVNDAGGSTGVTTTCSTANFVPLNSATPNVLGCSQIFDNGSTSVGIGYSTAAAANAVFPTVPGAWFSTSGTAYSTYTNYRLAVNGITRADGYLATSDKKFKKDIKPIENALKTIEAIDGKTYLWNREANKEMNFDEGGHSGFIAQELEKVLPHLVATGQNGDKAVNYMELMPYLVEAIKEQQSQIKEQQNQIVELNNKIQDIVTKGILDENKITNGRTYFSSNYPNPFDTVTKIDYFIDRNVSDAKFVVFDVNGATISNYNLKERGVQSILSINKDNLKTGVYFYTLITDGSVIGTKKMIVK